MIKAPSDSEIKNAATRFRDALDMVDLEHWRRIGLECFPRGACQRASHMMAKFLMAEFSIVLVYVHADFKRGDHGWLEWNGLTIDITGDQFSWPRVIVEHNSQWHAHTGVKLSDPICFEPEWWGPYCAAVWNEAVRIMGARDQA